MLLLLFPKLGHILERLTLSLRYQAPYEQGCNDTDNTIQTVGKPVAEVVTLSQMHVEHRHEGRADDEVEYPLEGNGNSNGAATDGVGEYLSNEHPRDGTP